jgi:hypothetical protein
MADMEERYRQGKITLLLEVLNSFSKLVRRHHGKRRSRGTATHKQKNGWNFQHSEYGSITIFWTMGVGTGDKQRSIEDVEAAIVLLACSMISKVNLGIWRNG